MTKNAGPIFANITRAGISGTESACWQSASSIIEELREWLKQYKSQLRCKICGESHPACLQFHHRDKEDKSFNIGGIVGRTHTSIKTLAKEVEKCDILCGNCHALLHWRETHDFDGWREVLPPMG